VERARDSQQHRLPTLAAMAGECGVSPGTMWQASRRFIESGEICARPRAGLHVQNRRPTVAAQSLSLDPPSPGVAARQHLEHRVRTARGTGIARLPTTAQLAKECGVSRGTMAPVVDQFRRRGVLDVRRRGGIKVLDAQLPGLQPIGAFAGSSRWERIATTLCREMQTYRARRGGYLPTARELGMRFGASAATIRRALEALRAQRLIEPDGRRFRAASVAKRRAGAGVVTVVAFLADMRRLTSWAPHSARLWQELERQLHRRGVSLQLLSRQQAIGFHRGPNGLREPLQTTLERTHSLGTVMLSNAIPQRTLDELCRRAPKAGAPLAYLQESAADAVVDPDPSTPIRTFPLQADVRAGVDVGRHLSAQGHRKVLFFGAGRKHLVSQRRFEGVSDAVTLAETDAQVHYVNLDVERLAVTRALRSESQYRELARLHKAHLAAAGFADGREEPIWNRRLGELTRWCLVRDRLDRTLREAVRIHPDASAWVFWNDDTALTAHWLLEHAPSLRNRQIALVGFDNTAESLAAGLTSYDFHTETTVQATLDYLLLAVPKPDRADHYEPDGHLVVRQSSLRSRQ
jgi:DNA-binding GntR family transcriptional regulator